jgi:hypothetical protein
MLLLMLFEQPLDAITCSVACKFPGSGKLTVGEASWLLLPSEKSHCQVNELLSAIDDPLLN